MSHVYATSVADPGTSIALGSQDGVPPRSDIDMGDLSLSGHSDGTGGPS